MERDRLSSSLPQSEPHVPRLSVYVESESEINDFKWIESERVGYDLGEAAVKRWVNQHWRGYLRARWLEHLQGTQFWIELDRDDFGLLQTNFEQHRDILLPILDRLKSGEENLDVICWAENNQIQSEPVCRILEALDINSRRLRHRFD